MTRGEIDRQITRYRRYIDSNNCEIQKLRRQLDELSNTQGKLNGSQSRFSDYLSAQRGVFGRMNSNYRDNRFAVNFSQGMLGCLGGREAAGAHENISAAIQRVKSKSNAIDSRIQELNRENRKYWIRIDDLEYERRHLAAKG